MGPAAECRARSASARTPTWSSGARKIIDQVAARRQRIGVVVLTDMFGGTPSNLAISIIDKARVEVIAGVNLPMLIKLAGLRQTENLANAVRGAQEAGRKYINVASQLLADARWLWTSPAAPPHCSKRPPNRAPPAARPPAVPTAESQSGQLQPVQSSVWSDAGRHLAR